ncbi:MAG: hypothetical protein HUJ30_02740 [Gammaproteobacteria bacterium]|nr:hypothetical protein [Gammaproteobacteria bacterium]
MPSLTVNHNGQPLEVSLAQDEIGATLLNIARAKAKISGAVDYLYTDDLGRTFNDSDDLVTHDPDVAYLVDAGNLLLHDKVMKQQDLFNQSKQAGG